MDTHQTTRRFEVVFDVEGRNIAKFRNEIAVHKRPPHPVSVDLPADEGPGHGGGGRWTVNDGFYSVTINYSDVPYRSTDRDPPGSLVRPAGGGL